MKLTSYTCDACHRPIMEQRMECTFTAHPTTPDAYGGIVAESVIRNYDLCVECNEVFLTALKHKLEELEIHKALRSHSCYRG